MNHQGTKEFETERLLLRQFTVQDAGAALRNWTGDPRVTEFLRWPPHSGLEVTRGVLSEWVASYRQLDFYQWAIEPKSLGEPIGTIGVVDQSERLDMVHIGYCIGSKWWNQGLTSEALAAIIPFFFDEVRVNRIESQHDPANPNSGKVMEKCGLVYEGTLRQADFSNRGVVDAVRYALLARDYLDMKNR